MTTEQTIKNLNKALEYEDYRQSWIANMAMAQIDCERRYREKNNKVGKYLNREDKHTIAKLGAERFLELLKG
mgnify:CR=1 FL=1